MNRYSVTLTDQSSSPGPVASIIVNVTAPDTTSAVEAVQDEMQALRVFNNSLLNTADVALGATSGGIMQQTISGSGAQSPVLSSASGLLRVTVASGVTSVNATIAAGQVDGQQLTIDWISSGSGLASVTVAGQLAFDNTHDATLYGSESITPSAEGVATYVASWSPAQPPIRTTWQWDASNATWYFTGISALGAKASPAAMGV